MSDWVDFVMSTFMASVALLLGVFAIWAGIAMFQSVQDSRVCREKTGLYSGCDLKMREHTENINVKGLEK